jgi:predicted nucleic acid-binding Zn ribbon protein
MPTYVYKFIDTGETIEIYQEFSQDALTEAPHPSDGKPRPVKKVFTPVGITFKGGGFYKTDTSSSSKTQKSKTESSKTESSKTESSGNESSKTDKKEEKKAPASNP